MRIALATANARTTGGAESYLDVVIPLLHKAGHQTALLCEYDTPTHRRRISIDQASPLWLVSESGMGPVLEALERWRPDVIFSQCMPTVALEEQMKAIAPVVSFVHTYYGLCISESKMFSFPVPLTCNRPLGKLCLAHFYPHRCGGLNPLTMLRDYRIQTARLRALRSSRTILTASEHMRSEILRHGFPPDTVRAVGLPVLDSTTTYPLKPSDYSDDSRSDNDHNDGLPYRVLFIGRMEKPKGASLLIDAMASAAAKLNRRLALTLAGDGRERAALENQIRSRPADSPSVEVIFTGWLDRAQLCALIDRSDLLAVPSLWPEPFGLVGVEAGLRGLPAVAFDTGGISAWLEDGVNGRLVRSRPPTALAFASALADCLSDPANHARLRQDARKSALYFSPQAHLEKLTTVLDAASR
jgi:glycosyltransferase involved in cell wall biosynthesis